MRNFAFMVLIQCLRTIAVVFFLVAPAIAQIPPAGLVSRWLADGNANDALNLNHGTLQNGASFAPGKVGQAFSFDGVNDYVLVPHSTSLNVALSHTVAVWAFRTSGGVPLHIVGKRNGCGFDTQFIQLAIGTNALPTSSVPLNLWSHLAVTYNGSLALFYVNGNVVGSWTAALGNNAASLLIGSSGTCAPFGGLIDDVQIYNRPLSQSEIQVTMQLPPFLRVGSFSQLATGGGWKTTITLLNLSATQISGIVNFYDDSGAPLTLPLSFPQTGGTATASFSSLSIDPNASFIVETEAAGSSIAVGWADVQASGGLQGYTIFRQRLSGVPDSEGTVPLDTQSSATFFLPYDNTNGFRTGVALANPSAASVTITVIVRDDAGNFLGSSAVMLQRLGHGAFFADANFPQTSNRRGVLELRSDSGNITGIGLRFSPSSSFTSVPIVR